MLFSVGLIKLSNFLKKLTYESVILISGSSLFHSFIVHSKKVFWKFLFYTTMAERNLLDFAEIFVMELMYHRDRKVALMTWPYINNKVFSYVVYLLKIQNILKIFV